jgi:CRISPR/Cas system Type II protein with McrA/HNH and RuvC-like nuclease domain
MPKPDMNHNTETVALTLSRTEYANLIKLVYAGDWLINSIRVPDEAIEKYKRIEQSVYKAGLENGFSDLLEFSDDHNEIFPSAELEESDVSDYIQEYNEQTMWEELIDALSTRDFGRKYAEAEIEAMSQTERINKQSDFFDKYGEEFEEYGTDHLEIAK